MNKLKATDEDADRGKEKSYTGFIGWSKKKCGKRLTWTTVQKPHFYFSIP